MLVNNVIDATEGEISPGRDGSNRSASMARRAAAGLNVWEGASPARARLALPVLYVLLIFFEGALRKWVAPGLERELYFIRDPLTLVLLGRALRSDSAAVRRLAATAAWLTLVMAVFGSVQVVVLGAPVKVIGVGVRAYSMPLLTAAGIASALASLHDWRWLMPTLSWLSVANAAVVVVQSVCPAGAAVNRIFAADGSDNLGLSNGLVRATGTFTSNAALTTAAALVFGVACAFLTDARLQASAHRGSAIAGALSSCVILCLAGSRGGLIDAGLVLTALVVSAAVQKRGRMSYVVGGATMAVLVGWTLLRLDPSYASALGTRIQSASQQEGLESRILYALFGFLWAIPGSPLLGHGLGMASQVGIAAGSSQQWIESDMARWIWETGPVIGVLASCGRIAISIRALASSFRSPSHPLSTLRVALIAALATALLTGPITSEGSITAIVGLGMGIFIVAGSAIKQFDGEDASPSGARCAL